MKRILTAAMAAIMTLGAFAFTGCDNVQILQRPTNTNTSGSATDFERGEFIVGESTNANGVSLLGAPISSADFSTYNIPQQAESAVLVTATVSPSSVVNHVEMSWKVAWKNASSTWASGKTVTDYVTVTQAGNFTATVTCLQPFGEQVVVTATASQGNTSKSASITCDYMKRYENIAFSTFFDISGLNSQDAVLTGSFELDSTEDEVLFDVGDYPHWDSYGGTRTGYFQISELGEETASTISAGNYTVTVTLQEDVADALENAGFDIGTGSVSFDSNDLTETFEHIWFVLPGANEYVWNIWYEMHLQGGYSAGSKDCVEEYGAYYDAMTFGIDATNNVDGYICYITIAFTNQDKTVIYEEYEVGCFFDYDKYLPLPISAVNSVTLDGDITF